MMLSENTPRSIYPFTFHETGKIMYYIGGASYADFPVSTSYAQDTWYSLEVAIDFSNSLFHWWVNGSDKGTAPLKNDLGTTLDISNSLTAVKGQAAATTANMYLDQVWVRNYTNPEPTWATPGVETASAGGASCDLTIPDPQAHGTIDFYTYIVDSHNTSASGGQQGALATFRVRDAVPTVSGTPSLNNTEPIDLINEESTTDIYVRGTVIDDNGCADTTASTTVDVWQTTLAGRSGCNTTGKADGNKCYYHMNCVYDGTVDPCEGGNDKTTSYKCTVPFQYYTNPTDTNTPWPTDSWTATFMPGDGQGPSAANESNTAPQEMNSFLALGLADSYNSISYGDLASGANTNPLLEKIRVKSTGNCSIDTNLSGTTMTGPGTAIPIANQRYGLGVGAPAWGDGVELSATSTLASVGVCKSGYALTPAWKPIWWGITIPSGQFSGAYTGTNTIAAVKKPWATTGDWCE